MNARSDRLVRSDGFHPALPRMARYLRRYPQRATLDIESRVDEQLTAALSRSALPPRATVAILIGSRGLANLSTIARGAVRAVSKCGFSPVVTPAMGSHGGGTCKGQLEILASYGLTEGALGARIEACVEAQPIGRTSEGMDVWCSAAALRADAVVPINRVKPHTDFLGKIGSGVLKMLAVGLGHEQGARSFHRIASRVGYEAAIRSAARVVLRTGLVVCCVCVVEDERGKTAMLEVVEPHELEGREEAFIVVANTFAPTLPTVPIDVLVIDRIGKNISGSGLDPRLIGRSPASVVDEQSPRRVFVRELSSETCGNAIGIGYADITTTRLIRSIDYESTHLNARTSLGLHEARIPFYCDCDLDAIDLLLDSLGLDDKRDAKLVRVADTRSLTAFDVSESLAQEVERDPDMQKVEAFQHLRFDEDGNLLAF